MDAALRAEFPWLFLLLMVAAAGCIAALPVERSASVWWFLWRQRRRG